jgi:hypothetical protein
MVTRVEEKYVARNFVVINISDIIEMMKWEGDGICVRCSTDGREPKFIGSLSMNT